MSPVNKTPTSAWIFRWRNQELQTSVKPGVNLRQRILQKNESLCSLGNLNCKFMAETFPKAVPQIQLYGWDVKWEKKNTQVLVGWAKNQTKYAEIYPAFSTAARFKLIEPSW